VPHLTRKVDVRQENVWGPAPKPRLLDLDFNEDQKFSIQMRKSLGSAEIFGLYLISSPSKLPTDDYNWSSRIIREEVIADASPD